MDKIAKEIDKSKFTTSDPETIIRAVEAGLSGEETASLALGFEEGEVTKARADHASRIARIQEAQSGQEGASKPGARGVKDLAVNDGEAAGERVGKQDPDLQGERKGKLRGEGKQLKKGDK
jgi:hypothetical protein